MSARLPILDAHVHLWDPRTTPRTVSPALRLLGWNEKLLRAITARVVPQATRDFVGNPEHVLRPYLPGTYRRDRASFDVRGFVHVQADWQTRDPFGYVGETRWLEEICGSELHAIVAHADLSHPRIGAILDAHAHASSRFVGIRDMLAFSDDRGVVDWARDGARMRDPAWQRGYALLGERGLTFDAWVYSTQLAELERLVSSFAGTRVIVDHLGTPIGLGGPYAGSGATETDRARIAARWHEDLAKLAEHPHVRVKISGLTMPVLGWGFHERSSPPSVAEVVDALGPHVERAIALFGAERCAFASNFPMDKVSLPWTTLFEAFFQLTASLDERARRCLFRETAQEHYRTLQHP